MIEIYYFKVLPLAKINKEIKLLKKLEELGYKNEIFKDLPNCDVDFNDQSYIYGDPITKKVAITSNEEVINNLKQVGVNLDQRWRAEKDKPFWRMSWAFAPERLMEVRDSYRDDLWMMGNYFEKKEECQEYCDKVRKLFQDR